MTALPTVADFVDSGVTEAQFKTAMTNLRGFLAGIAGTDGLTATALSTLGALGGKVATKTAAYTVLAADRGVVFHCSGTFTLTLAAAATLRSGFSFAVINTGTGAITIDPNAAELIDGATTKVLTAGTSGVVTCNGAGFFVISGGGSSNADTVDGFHAVQTATANRIAVRDASGNLAGNILGNAATASSIASASVSQSKLKTTTGAVSTATAMLRATLPGGEYGFREQVKSNSTDGDYFQVVTLERVNAANAAIGSAVSTSYFSCIQIGTSGTTTIYAQQRYVQASPPYDLGDGEIPLFCFALVNKNGEVLSMYSAPEAPWHNNGPTSLTPDFYNPDGTRFKRVLRTDLAPEDMFHCPIDELYEYIEITQAVKQADMSIVPHPFLGNDLTGLTVVLIDPVSDHIWRATEVFEDKHSEHQDLYYKNKLIIDNAALKRNGPPGVQVAGVRWKNSK